MIHTIESDSRYLLNDPHVEHVLLQKQNKKQNNL